MRVLGSFEIDNGRERLMRLRSRAATLLLARLALAPTRDHAREELCGLLWPDASATLGRSRLRQTLSMLRALLEPPGSTPVLLVDQRVLRVLPGALWCDAVAFERAAVLGDSSTALGHYGGDLLPGFYDEWVHDERLRLAGLAGRLSGRLLGHSTGQFTGYASPALHAVGLVCAPAISIAPATVRSMPRLPSYWTSAFGQQPSIDRLQALVAVERLVTVHGPGGSGKTRLAVATTQAFNELRQADASLRFVRIEFVPLLACATTVQALDALGQALHVEGTGDAHTRLTAALDGGPTLLVLDNAEQLVADDLGHAITRLLSALPELHVLVTSRRLLDVDGETSFALEGLPLPATDVDADPVDSPALALFVARARAARVDFHINAPSQARAAVGLVRLLAGMPLAIELAASRMRSLSAVELLQRLQEGAGSPMLKLLARTTPRSTQRATPDARHLSMRLTIAWSWDQLTAPQLQLLQALAIPAVAVRLEAAAALADLALPDAQQQLHELMLASLVHIESGADGCQRYGLLQPVREFAAENSPAAQVHAARLRLRGWLLDFARDAMQKGPMAIAPDIGVVDLAITSAPGDGALADALALALALRQYWNTALPSVGAVLALEQALAVASGPDQTVLARELLAFICLMQGRTADALAYADAAVATPCGDRARSLALARWSWVRYGTGQLDSDFDTTLNESALLARRCGDLRAQGRALFMQSVIASDLRLQFALAEQLVAERQAIWAQLGDQAGVNAARLNRAVLWAHQGRIEAGIATAIECETMLSAGANQAGYAFASAQLARIYLMARRCGDAAAAFRRSIEVSAKHHLAQYLARALLHLPNALAAGSDAPMAARLHGFGTTHYQRHFAAWNRIEARELCRTRRLLRQRLGVAQFEARQLEGAVMTLSQAVALALARTTAPP